MNKRNNFRGNKADNAGTQTNIDKNRNEDEFDRKPMAEDADDATDDVNKAEDDRADDVAESDEEGAELETLKSLLERKENEVEKEKKEYMFLMAEFDNFRKRTLRERTDLIKSASEKALKGLLPVIDDFERGLDAIRDSSDTDAVKEGMKLIYNKFIKYLADNGVKEIESTGADFDTEVHEAVAMVPATDESEKGKVKDTVSKGYMLNDKVLRHAKVVVAQ